MELTFCKFCSLQFRAAKLAMRTEGAFMKRLIFLAVGSLLLTLASAAQRLPDNALPESYDLKFEPHLPDATFAGEETIHLRLRQPATSIVLNSAEIEFVETTVRSGDSTQIAQVTTDDKNEIA